MILTLAVLGVTITCSICYDKILKLTPRLRSCIQCHTYTLVPLIVHDTILCMYTV